MASPFTLIAKIPPVRRAMEKQYLKRANQVTRRISPHIKKNEKIIDVGSGTGFVAKLLMQKTSARVTLVDVRHNPLCSSLPITLYDGKKLPFSNNSFDTASLIAVLHHCNKPIDVLDEAIRVASTKIIIMEDLFESRIEKWLTLIEDSIVNWEFRGHPHNNRLEDEWIKIFHKKNLKIIKFEKFRLVCAGFPFRLGIFILEKQVVPKQSLGVPLTKKKTMVKDLRK